LLAGLDFSAFTLGLSGSVEMIYLVGVNHGVQFVNRHSDGNVINAFENYLRETCREYRIQLIAEEMSMESLKKWKATRYVCTSIADELFIKHIFCDPDSNERKKKGIKLEREVREELGYGQILSNSQVKRLDEALKTQWPLREQFWLQKILEAKADRTLFVLGSSHIESFSELLSQKGIGFVVLERK
jgi:hypothetical protein